VIREMMRNEMISTTPVYKTSDIARKTSIHPNTVRFYERLELISAVPRNENGYRIFDDRHLTQVRILRCIFLDDWPGTAIRKASLNIIEAMKAWDLAAARHLTREYKKTIKEEYEKARQAIDILEQWTATEVAAPETNGVEDQEETHSRKEAAAILGVTPEALRNWERNDLIHIPRKGQHQTRIYSRPEMERLKVIYLLRQARFSMSAIHRCLSKLNAGCTEEALEALRHPDEENCVWTGDRWLIVLDRTFEKAREIEEILDHIKYES
jgi:DNA-binding transcriptional MerR regulator